MPKPQLYVLLSASKIRVRKEQKDLVDQHCARRGVSISQAVRDALDYAEFHGFFLGNGIANGNVSTPKGE